MIHHIVYQHLLTVVHHITSENYYTLHLVVEKNCRKKTPLLNDVTELQIIENPFQSPCSSADLVNNQSTPCTISSFSKYSFLNSENLPFCEAIVKTRDKAICCDLCSKWIHIKCNNLNDLDYGYLK